jgi:hypothetical protein
MAGYLCLDGVLDFGESRRHSALLVRFLPSLVLGECPSHGPRFLGSQILGHVLGPGACLANPLLLLLVVDSQDSSNGLSHRLDFSNLGGSPVGHLGHMQLGQLLPKVLQRLDKVLLGQIPQFVSFHHIGITKLQHIESGRRSRSK